MIIEKGEYCYPISNNSITINNTINAIQINVLWHNNIIFNKSITDEQIRLFNYIDDAQNNKNVDELGKILADEVSTFLLMNNEIPAYFIDTNNSLNLYHAIIKHLEFRKMDNEQFRYVKLSKKSVFELIKQYKENPFFIVDTYLPITIYNLNETLYDLPLEYGNTHSVDYEYHQYLKLKEKYNEL